MVFHRPTPSIRFVLLLILCLLSVAVSAQEALTPRWGLTAWKLTGWPYLSERPQYSKAGDKILLWNAGTYDDASRKLRVYRVSDGAILAQVNFDRAPGFGGSNNGNLTGACFGPEGDKVYFATDHGLLFEYDLQTRTSTKLPPRERQNRPVYDLVVSRDGTRLAYMAGDPETTQYDLACVYNIETRLVESHFKLTKPNNVDRAKTQGLAFADNDTKLVASGPAVYDLAGNKVKQDVHEEDAFVVNPLQNAIFTFHNSFSGSTAYAHSAINFSVGQAYPPLWQKPAPAGARSLSGVSSDGQAVVFSCTLSNSWAALGLYAVNGTPVANPFVTSTTLAASFVAPSPVGNTLFVTDGSLGQTWTYSGALQGTLFDGVAKVSRYGGPSAFEETKGPGASASAVAVVVDELYGTMVKRNKRDAWSGAKMETLIAGAHPSPDGRFFVLLTPYNSGTGINVYPAGSNVSVASGRIDDDFYDVVWGDASRFIVSNGYRGHVFEFDGTSLSELPDFSYNYFGFSGRYSFSQDGERYCTFAYNNDCIVYDARTGFPIRTIPHDPNSVGRIRSASFAGSNRIGIHEVVDFPPDGLQNQYRVYDITGNPFLVRPPVRYKIEGALDGSAGVLSPDGETIVMGHTTKSLGEDDPRRRSVIRLYNVATGAMVGELADHLFPDILEANTFTFSRDSRTVRWTSDGALLVAPTTAKLFLNLEPSTIQSQGTSKGTVTLGEPAEATTTVTLYSSSGSAVLQQSSVTFAPNEVSKTFDIQAGAVGARTTAQITATWGTISSTAPLTINAPTLAELTFTPSETSPGYAFKGKVTLTSPAPSGGYLVTLSSGGSPYVTLPTPASVRVEQGMLSSPTFDVVARTPPSDTSVTITASYGGVDVAAQVRIVLPVLLSVSLDPIEVEGGIGSTGTVTISAPAPPAGTSVTIKYGNHIGGLATVIGGQEIVKVLPGKTSQTFPIKTEKVPDVYFSQVRTEYNGVRKTENLKLLPVALQSFTVSPSTAVGGYETSTATVTLKSALSHEVSITLQSLDPKTATLQELLTIPAGATSGQAVITTYAVTAAKQVNLKATLGVSSLPASLIVTPVDVNRVELSKTSVTGVPGGTVGGTVYLSGPAPKGGLKVKMVSTDTGAATVPKEVPVLAGQRSASFTVTTLAVSTKRTATIKATLISTKECALEVLPPVLTGFTLAPNPVKGGTKLTCTVTISSLPPTAGLKITLTSTDASIPATTVTIPKGKTTYSVKISTNKVTSERPVTVTAKLNDVSILATVTVKP